MTPRRLPLLALAAQSIFIFFSACYGCGQADPSIYPGMNFVSTESTDNTNIPSSMDSTDRDNSNCPQIEWGAACRKSKPTYNVTFEGWNADIQEIETVSLDSLRCKGHESAVLVFGDAECPACPAWYSKMATISDEIHENGGVVITTCTSNYGADVLPHQSAFELTAQADPDYTTGASPLTYPCKYDFTPFTMVVDLSNATILAMDSAVDRVTTEDILRSVALAASQ